ncbi:MAG: hypothetical protein V3V08_01300, partial [Nannocystaceae bacterium]
PLPEPTPARPTQLASRCRARAISASVHQLRRLRVGVVRKGFTFVLTSDPILDRPRFAAVSWTWVHEFDQVDVETLLCFVAQHERQAPEQPSRP